MALTVQTDVSGNVIYPSYNPIRFGVESSSTSEDNYKTIVYIHRDPSGDDEKVAELRYDIRPSTNAVLVDVSKITQSFVSTDIANVVAETVGGATESSDYEEWKVAFQEYFGAIPAATGSVVSGTTFYTCNGAFRFEEWKDYNYYASEGNWVVLADDTAASIVSSNIWMHDWGNVHTTSTGATGLEASSLTRDLNWLPIQAGQYLPLRWRKSDYTEGGIYINLYDENFSLNHQDGVDWINAPSEYCVRSMNVGTDELNATAGITFTVNTDDKYMAVCWYDPDDSGGGAAIRRGSNFLLYEIDHTPCDTYTNYEILWLNRLGGIDSYVFTGRPYKNYEWENSRYMRNTVSINTDGSTITDNLHARKMGTDSTRTKRKYKVNSRIIPAWMAEGFADLFSSPMVWWRRTTETSNQLIQIVPQGSMYEVKNSVGDKAFNIELDFVIDSKDVRQRG